METSFRLEIVTPEKVVFDGQVESLQVPASDGLMGVLPNHAPLLAELNVGPIDVKEVGGKERLMFISDGFLQVADNHAKILANAGERAEDIDVQRAEAAVDRARARMKEHGKLEGLPVDMIRAEFALQRALWRLRVGKRAAGR